MRRLSIARIGLLAATTVVACGTTGAGTGAATGSTQHSGVAGRVTAGPTCPVEQVGHPCPPRPVTATVRAQQGGRVVRSTRSGSDGSYAITLRPGRYTLIVQTGSTFPRCPSTPVTVPPNRVVTTNISCDTGIR